MTEFFRKFVRPECFPTHPSSIRFRTNFSTCILEVLQARGYVRVEDDSWQIYWHEKEGFPEFLDRLQEGGRRVNHFRQFSEICRKDNLSRNLKKHRRKLEKEGRP
jgi:hypothetical protein